MRDLLGDHTAPANQFPPDDFVNGFKNQYEAQNLSPLLEEAYSDAAEHLAANAFRNGDTQSFDSLRAFRPMPRRHLFASSERRPSGDRSTAQEIAPLCRVVCQASADFVKGAQLVVEAMLQSPNFLFRLDATPNPALRPYATASRLSYALWDTMPDDALAGCGGARRSGYARGRDEGRRRMLRDPRAHQALDEFVSQWLRFDRILTATRDRRRYPQFNRETAVAMTQEARLFIGDLVWNDRNFMDAFTANYGFVNADLAAIYGVPAPAREFDRVTFPADSERAGLLGQALFLALTSKPEDASLTGRGLFVREQFLCQHVPPPPAGVNTNLPPSTEAHPQTNRDRMSEHVTNPTCASCHRLIDPIGFGLEKFDAIGARREEFKLTFFNMGHGGGGRRTPPKSVMLPIDTQGHGRGHSRIRLSPRRASWARSWPRAPQCQECMVKQYFRYVDGPHGNAGGPSGDLDRIFQDFQEFEFSFQRADVVDDSLPGISGRREEYTCRK